jgi:chromosome partitioning protein
MLYGMVISVVNRKGGSAKSTVALHLAAALADHTPPVALVDLDDENRSALDYAAGGHLPITTTDPTGWAGGLNRQRWAHVVADAYARPTPAQLRDLAAQADLLLVPTPPDAASLRVLARTLPELRALPAPFAVLLAVVPPRPSQAGERARRDLLAGGVPVLQTSVPRAAAVATGARARRLAWDVPGGSRLRWVFDDLAREVLTYAKD